MSTVTTLRLFGRISRYWGPTELSGCPYGTLVYASCPGDVPDNVLQALHPAERRYASGLQGDRRREWIAGRYCLAVAIGKFTSRRNPVLPLRSGAPALPSGLRGSLSHKSFLTVALAAKSPAKLGVDVEFSEHADVRLAGKVLTATEQARFAVVDGSLSSLFVVAHFALKEAIYKASRAAQQQALDFDRIELTVPSEKLLKEGSWLAVPARLVSGRCRVNAAILRYGKWIIAAASCV